MRILVRKDELACRNSWGSDLWVSASASDAESAAEPAARVTEDLIIPLQKLDDEITSVVVSDSIQRPDRSNPNASRADPDMDDQDEDVVVGEASLVPERRDATARDAMVTPSDDELDEVNVAAHDDQARRAEVIARGSLDAILQARERIQLRRAGSPRPSSGAGNQTPESGSLAVPDAHQTDAGPVGDASPLLPSDADTGPSDPIPAPRKNMHKRRVSLPIRAYHDPLPPVPTNETQPADPARGQNRVDSDKFDTVPEIDPEFELPRIDDETRERLAHEQEIAASSEFEASAEILPEDQLNAYELVLQRARAIRAATLAERNRAQATSPKRRSAPEISSRRTPQAERILPTAAAQSAGREDRHQETPPTRQDPRVPLARPVVHDEPTLERSEEAYAPSDQRKRFDVSLLIGRGISFRRPSTIDASSDFSGESDDVDSYLDDDSPAVSPPRRTRRDTEAHARPGTLPPLDELEDLSPVVDTDLSGDLDDEPALSTYRAGWGEDAIPAWDEPGDAAYPEWGEQALNEKDDSAPEESAFTRTPGQQRDLYRPRTRDASTPAYSWDEREPDRGQEQNPPRRARGDYRIRASQVETAVLPDLADPNDEPYGGLESAIIHDDGDPGLVAATVASELGNEWSFDPSVNLRDAGEMNAFRSRLFGSSGQVPEPSPRSPQAPESHGAAGSFDDYEQHADTRADRHAATSAQRSPLCSGAFTRPEREAGGERDRRGRRQATVSNAPQAETLFTPAEWELGEETLPQIDTDRDPISGGRPEFDIRDVLAHHGDLLDMTISLAPELPRSCRTCRDFRPSESGERGWCTNEYAFTHRPMVDADDLACQSTIGCWWLPYDEVWMPDEPVTAPTPRVAKMVTTGRGRQRSS